MRANTTAPDDALKHKSDRTEQHAATVTRAVTIGRPREEVYAFWRDFGKLANVLESVETIEDLGSGRTRWTISTSNGETVEWDVRITEDEPGRRIAWASEPGAKIANHGVVEFRDAPGDRGSEVHAAVVYEPPAGVLGKFVATLFQKEPGQQAHRDLRRVKMFMETGEIATTKAPDAAPRYKKSVATPAEQQAETR